MPAPRVTPAALAGLYADRELMLFGEARGLFPSGHERPQRWLRVFRQWPHKFFFSSQPLQAIERFMPPLQRLGFRRAALSTPALEQLADGKRTEAEDDAYDLSLPPLFQREPQRWVRATGFSKRRFDQAVETLRRYLGHEGFLLLAAGATYPQLRWELTRALDLQLRLDGKTREWRLRKLARLPWFRYGHVPVGLRYALHREIGETQLARIADSYHAFFDSDLERPLILPVAVPEWRGRRGRIDAALRGAVPGTPLADRVLASVIRGRRPRQWEFTLPLRALKRRLLQDWRALVRPVLSGALMIPALLWLNLHGWRSYGHDWAREHALGAMRAGNSGVSVAIGYVAGLRPRAINLADGLKARGFRVGGLNEIASDPAPRIPPSAGQRSADRLLYQGLDQGAIDSLHQALGYIGYHDNFILEGQDTAMASGQALIELRARPRVFQDTQAGMVFIPGGCYQMGSPETESERGANEKMHRVCVGDLYLGRYEVTFAEYDAFAEATGREKPGDKGWGRGSRPVIDVSWDDAVAYTAWLSRQTGQDYRLPTEAEWEYAARAGSSGAFWWGDRITADQANYDGNFTYNGGEKGINRGRTLPVGGFRANPFGLHDAHGNVFEWTCSNYDVDYGGGETRCVEPGTAFRRVLRGGSWSGPWGLRSADRNNGAATYRNDDVGFRLARAVP